jgi:hypothetical protein
MERNSIRRFDIMRFGFCNVLLRKVTVTSEGWRGNSLVTEI